MNNTHNKHHMVSSWRWNDDHFVFVFPLFFLAVFISYTAKGMGGFCPESFTRDLMIAVTHFISHISVDGLLDYGRPFCHEFPCPPHRVASPRWMDGPLLFVHQNNKFDFLNNQTSSFYSDPMAEENQTKYYKCVNERTNRSRNVRVHLLLPRRVFKCSSVHTQTIAYSERPSERKETWNWLLIPWGSSRRGHHARLVLTLHRQCLRLLSLISRWR